jgi:hypothetical protein
MTWLPVALLFAALVVLVGAEWPRVARLLGVEGRQRRGRGRRKAKLKLLNGGDLDDPDEFAASVARDLANLPTIEERDRS